MKEKYRILIVDDDEMLADTLVDICAFSGYDAEAVFCGTDALKRLKERPFDCVISDIKMPDINGVELLGKIKRMDKEIPVILITAYTTDDLVLEGKRKGAYEVLSKPFDADRLLLILKAVLLQHSDKK